MSDRKWTKKDVAEFEARWTVRGIPDEPELRCVLGFVASRLVALGADEELLGDYVASLMKTCREIAAAKRGRKAKKA